MNTDEIGRAEIFKLAGEIVTAHVTNNAVAAGEVARLISSVHDALSQAANPPQYEEVPAYELAPPRPWVTPAFEASIAPEAEPERAPEPAPVPVPIVPIEDSVRPDALICLDCGRRTKILTRHLKATHQMSPYQYREKWGLPKDYPMTAADYTAALRERALGPGGTAEKMRAGRGLEPRQRPESDGPAASPAESVHHDHLTCLDCGKDLKTLTTHLREAHGLFPDEYRAKWQLPESYPMDAPYLTALKSAGRKKRGKNRRKPLLLTESVRAPVFPLPTAEVGG